MKHIRTLAVFLAALFALTAAGASAKSTLPEWGGCEVATNNEGHFGNASCTDPVKRLYGKYAGEYEWNTGAAFHNGYGIEGYAFYPVIGATTFETTGGAQIACSGGSGEINLGPSPGEIKGALLTFAGCKEAGGEQQPCHSAEYFPNGENGYISNEFVKWDEGEGLRGKLGFVAGKRSDSPTVGLSFASFNAFKPETKEHERLLTAICRGSLGTVWIGEGKKGKNEVISLITPVDQMTTEYQQVFSQSAPGLQSPAGWEKGGAVYLQEFLLHNWERSSWASLFTDNAEEGAPPIEIKAVP